MNYLRSGSSYYQCHTVDDPKNIFGPAQKWFLVCTQHDYKWTYGRIFPHYLASVLVQWPSLAAKGRHKSSPTLIKLQLVPVLDWTLFFDTSLLFWVFFKLTFQHLSSKVSYISYCTVLYTYFLWLPKNKHVSSFVLLGGTLCT